MQDMELGLKRVMLVGGVAQRLLGKVAIVTGLPAVKPFIQCFCIQPVFASLLYLNSCLLYASKPPLRLTRCSWGGHMRAAL